MDREPLRDKQRDLPEMEPLREKPADPPGQTRFRVFVSHSHIDNDFCVQVVNDLRVYLGEDEAVWYDAVGLHGGDAWWRRIVAEVKARNVFIVVLSPDAMESAWVHDEIDLAWQRKNSPEGMLIIPMLWRACEVRDDLKTRQIISFLSPKPYEMAFQELIRALSPKSDNPPPRLPPLYSTSAPRPRSARPIPPMWMPSSSRMRMDVPYLEDVAFASRTPDDATYTQAPDNPFSNSDNYVKVPDAGNVLGPIKDGLLPVAPSTENDPVLEFVLGKVNGRVNDFLRWFAIVIEVVLLLRFLLKIIGASPTNVFASFIYALSNVVLLPFSGIINNPSLNYNQAFEWTTLIAMAIYWMIFWLLRWFMRISISKPVEPIE